MFVCILILAKGGQYLNALDFILIGILLLSAIIGFRRGLVLTVFRFVSFILALLIASRLYPIVSRFLRDSFIYENIRGRIAGAANIEGVFQENIPNPDINEALRGREIINSLPLPQSMREMLYEGNTPDMFELLRVNTIEDYISGFFANIVINVISLVLVFILALVILHFIGKALKIVDRIPVINTFNRVGGLIVGALIGAGIVWLCVTVITMFFSVGASGTMYELMQGSALTRWLLDNGWLLDSITAV